MGSFKRIVTMGRLLVVALLIIGTGAMAIMPHTASAAASLHYLFGSGSATGGKQISLRIELTEPAPLGGAVVNLTSNNAAIPVPATLTVGAGETEETINVTTVPVTSTVGVTVAATYLGVTKSRVVTIKEPHLSYLSVQTITRGGGNGRVTVGISGRAPAGGLVVRVTSNRPSLFNPPGNVTIPAGASSIKLSVPAGNVNYDVPVNVIAFYDGVKIVKTTIIRDLSEDETPTATATVEASPTATITETPTEEASPSPTNEASPSPTEEVTETPTEEVTETPTEEVTETPTEEVTETPTEEVTETPTEEVTETPTQEP